MTNEGKAYFEIIRISAKIRNMNIDQSIFKSYDIRGIYPQQLNPETAGFGVV